ncbi:MAG: hypothetical protein R3D45_16605 [Rhizobiaceae bacterium]
MNGGPRAGFPAALRAAMPGWRPALLGSLAWGLVMAASAAFGLWSQARAATAAAQIVLIVFAAGGFLAWAPALLVARLVGARRPEQRFAAFFVMLTVATLAVTGMIFALYFRYYFSQWHGAFLTLRWAFEFGFTVAAALYQFAVLGFRLYFPLGFIALFAAAAWNARRPR